MGLWHRARRRQAGGRDRAQPRRASRFRRLRRGGRRRRA
ncbi:hypothetical protein, partial [Mesorhizobium sp.]